jgi:O-antigen ligase
MKTKTRKWLVHWEILGLYLLIFALPTMESVKWAGLGLYLFGTLGRRWLGGQISWRRPQGFEWMLLIMIGSALISMLANWPLPNGTSGIEKVLTYCLLGWLIYTGGYSQKQVLGLLVIMTAGVLVGLVWSAHDLFSGQNPFLEFHSIPNLNRSAIYQLIALFMMLGMVLDVNFRSLPSRLFFGCGFVVSLVALLVMGSRAALLGFMTGSFVLALCLIRKKIIWLWLFLGLAAVFSTMAWVTVLSDNPVLKARMKKFTHYYHDLQSGGGFKATITESERVRWDYAKLAWAQITQGGHFLLGTGPGTYNYIDVGKLDIKKPLYIFKKKSWTGPGHPHNEFLWRWVEIGLIGLVVHLVFLGFLAVTLYRCRPNHHAITWDWVSCVGFLTTALVCGLFNTVLTSEMGWLAMIGVGSCMSTCREKTGIYYHD